MVNQSELRKTLEQDKRRLEQELADLTSGMPSPEERREGSPFGKREEEAAETYELEKRLALEKKLRDLMSEVDLALEKLDKGTYGLCDLCGSRIASERLEAMPAARLCLKCKAAQDGKARPHR